MCRRSRIRDAISHQTGYERLLIRSGLQPDMTGSLRERIIAGLAAIDFETAKIIILVIGDDENVSMSVCVAHGSASVFTLTYAVVICQI